MGEKRTSTITRHELELGEQTRRFLEGLTKPPIGETSIGQKLDALLTAINNLDRKVESKMSELSDAVQSIKDDVVRIDTGVKAVIAKLEQPNPDVANAVAALKEADAGLDAAATAMEAVLNPALPGPTIEG